MIDARLDTIHRCCEEHSSRRHRPGHTPHSTTPRILPTRRSTAALSTILLLATALMVKGPHSSFANQPETSGQGSRFWNSNRSAEGSFTLELQELWRAGGEDSDILFGVISRVIPGADGNIYMLDMQLSEVQVFSPDGRHLRTLSREGEGPGEVRNPSDMFFAPDGRIGLVQTMPGKVVFVNPDGTPGGTLQVGGSDPTQGAFSVLVTGSCRGGNLVLGGISMSFTSPSVSEQTYFLSSFSMDGTELHRYLSKKHTLNFAEFYMDEETFDFVWQDRYVVHHDGRVFAASDRSQYEMQVFKPDGSIDREIARSYENRKRSAADKEQAQLLLKAIAANYPMPPRGYRVLDTDPDITMLQVHPDSTVWVRNSWGDYSAPAGLLAVFDVFSPEGRYLRQVDLKAPGDPREDAVFLIDTDRFLVVTQALSSYRSMQGVAKEADGVPDTAPMEVICYTVKR